MKMKIIEFFSGTKQISNMFKHNGHQVLSIDFDKSLNPDICIDIIDFNINILPGNFKNPDILWFSPPCQNFSVCTISKNFKNGKPIRNETLKSIDLVKKCLDIIQELKPKYWFIENPRGMLRKMSFMPNGLRKTLTYCQYGEKYQKPTDIWTNCSFWIPKKACKSGMNCHEYQPRSYKKKINRGIIGLGVQGLKNAKERGKIPYLLCYEILKVCEGKVEIKQNNLLNYE